MAGKTVCDRILLTAGKTFVGLFLIAFVTALPIWWIFELAWVLLTGWFYHITRVAPKLEWNLELVFCFLLALALGTWMLHRCFLWFHQQGVLKKAWTPRVTLSLTALLLMLFGMSVAMTGIVHQTIWIMKGPVARYHGRSMHVIAINEAKNLFVACLSYAHDHEGCLPENLNELLPNDDYTDGGYVEFPEELFYQPENQEFPLEPWVYYPWTTSDRTRLIMFHSSSPAFQGKWIVAKLDSSVRLVSDEEFQAMLAETKAEIRKKAAAEEAKNREAFH